MFENIQMFLQNGNQSQGPFGVLNPAIRERLGQFGLAGPGFRPGMIAERVAKAAGPQMDQRLSEFRNKFEDAVSQAKTATNSAPPTFNSISPGQTDSLASVFGQVTEPVANMIRQRSVQGGLGIPSTGPSTPGFSTKQKFVR